MRYKHKYYRFRKST